MTAKAKFEADLEIVDRVLDRIAARGASKLSKLEHLFKVADGRVRHYERILAEWKTSFESSPSYALSWSGGAFQGAAALDIYHEIRTTIARRLDDSEETRSQDELYALLAEHYTKQAIQRAQIIATSSSRASNMMEDHTRAIWANVAHNFNLPDMWV